MCLPAMASAAVVAAAAALRRGLHMGLCLSLIVPTEDRRPPLLVGGEVWQRLPGLATGYITHLQAAAAVVVVPAVGGVEGMGPGKGRPREKTNRSDVNNPGQGMLVSRRAGRGAKWSCLSGGLS